MPTYLAIIASFIAGILPAVLWLKFWMKEDNHREPRHIILGAFGLGMLMVPLAFVFQQTSNLFFLPLTISSLFVWALIEEILKFSGAYWSAIKTRFNDEPVDTAIYLISSALGFSAVENMIYLMDPIENGNLIDGFSLLTSRLVGATVLHIVIAGAIGLIMSFVFYKSETIKKIVLLSSLFVAILLHTIYNKFIISIESRTEGLIIFSIVWFSLFVVIILLEDVKRRKKQI